MRNRFLSVVTGILCFAMGAGKAAYGSPAADEIVKKVDALRNPAESFFMKVEVLEGAAEGTAEGTDEGADEGADVRKSVFEVSIQGNNRTFIRTLEPMRDRGRNLLMLDEEMWAYVPNIKRAVRVSLGQKLTGQAANGDISRMRWSGDYDAVIENEEDEKFVLFLSARKKGLTYDKIRVWVEKKTFHPLRAEFLSPAGKALKFAEYAGFRQIAGQVRPTEIRIQDALREKDRSIVRVLLMEPRSFPASLFNQNALR